MPDQAAIGDDELLYRLIPTRKDDPWYHPDAEPGKRLEPHAFRANKNDVSGISLFRARLKPLNSLLADRPAGKAYYVAELRAGALRAAGIEIVSSEHEGGRGHVSLPAINSENRKSAQATAFKTLLA